MITEQKGLVPSLKSNRSLKNVSEQLVAVEQPFCRGFLLLRYTFLLLQPGCFLLRYTFQLLQPGCFLLLQAANFGQKLPNCIHSQYTGPLMSAKGLLSVQLDRSTNVPQQTSQRAVYNSLDDPQTPLLDRSARTSLWTILFCGCY